MATLPTVYKTSDFETVAPTFGFQATDLEKLLSLSKEAQATAYCPYSQFRVGSTILLADGSFVSGANVENASYPVGTCAERVALGKIVTDPASIKETGKGGRAWSLDTIKAIAVSTDITPPASPCGMCRQFIREFCSPDMPIFMFAVDGTFVVQKLEQLLPMSFGPEALPPPVR